MSKRANKTQKTEEPVKPPRRVLDRRRAGATHDVLPASYRQACDLAQRGSYDKARRLYARLEHATREPDSHLRALIRNDLAVLEAFEGRYDDAQRGWHAALELDQDCLQARLNRDLVRAELELASAHPHPDPIESSGTDSPTPDPSPRTRIRVAILSFLFNWPSTGGGNMHTAGLAQFLARAGYGVKHYYARYPAWGIGRVTDKLNSPSEALEFDEASWNVGEIQARYRRAVDQFQPDYVVITDAWNMKPLLAEAVRDYPCLLLFQAQENLCPLNNLRLLGVGPGQVEQCPRNQLATPEVCHRCLAERGQHSGALHQCERALAGVGTPEYDQKLRRSLREADGVLVLNPLTAAMLEPYASSVRIVPWGIDPARFPWPLAEEGDEGRPAVAAEGGVGRPAPSAAPAPSPVVTLFMSAVAGEFIKGFHVAHEACRILRQTRSDFELVVTFDPPGPGPIDEFTRSVGWCSQAELPRHYRAADICLVPTIAQDGLSITSVEAMASGIPVIASRVGGLPYTVADGVNGLLCEPGDPVDLARQIARLLDDPTLRRQMGLAGRKRFEEDFTWEVVIERYWRPILAQGRVGRVGRDAIHRAEAHR
ncbi:MAG: glycosyltransferase [Isosphaerales bacterium]